MVYKSKGTEKEFNIQKEKCWTFSMVPGEQSLVSGSSMADCVTGTASFAEDHWDSQHPLLWTLLTSSDNTQSIKYLTMMPCLL